MRMLIAVLAVSLAPATADEPKKPKPPDDKAGWKSLFDGKSLGHWKSTEFVNGGKVEVAEGAIRLGAGQPMTGIVYKGPKLPNDDYEISWEAKRTEGKDFFSLLTFPVGDEPCSFVVGGWGGNVSGLSSLNGADASENGTNCFIKIENDKWYKFRLKTTSKRIEAWVGDEKVVDVAREEFTFSVRIENDRCRPFGFASYRSAGMIRDVKIRDLKAPAPAEKSK
jgi:hypothetical protein